MRYLGLLSFSLSVFLSIASPALAADPWSPGPEMNTGRSAFPLVELSSGTWLVAGGATNTNGGFGSQAEILASDGSSWTTIAPMPTPHRGLHHGVLLQNASVLIAGEDPHIGSHPHPRNAYTYTDITGTWTATANEPDTHRFLATMTLLPDGRVLFPGGYSNHSSGPTYASAEIYDPNTNSWSNTGSMAEVRTGHTAALLTSGPNAGKVLVVGGSDRFPNNSTTTGCELYDPATGTWSAAASLHESRSLHTMTRLADGRLLVVGGQINTSTAGRNGAEIYDPATNTWSQVASMAGPRYSHSATLLPSGEILVVGGVIGPGITTVLDTVEIYDPATDTWSVAEPIETPRHRHAAALLANGHIIIIGGLSASGTTGHLASTEILDPALVPVELQSFSVE